MMRTVEQWAYRATLDFYEHWLGARERSEKLKRALLLPYRPRALLFAASIASGYAPRR